MKKLALIASLAVLLVGCSSPADSASSNQSASTSGLPVLSTAAAPVSHLGRRLNISDLYSLQPVAKYQYSIENEAIYLGNLGQDIGLTVVYFDHAVYEAGSADSFFEYIAGHFVNISEEAPAQQQIGDLVYRTIPFTAFDGELDLQGRYYRAILTDQSEFFAWGYGTISEGRNAWELEGQQAMEDILYTVEIGPSAEVGQTCEVSGDPTYAFSEDNAVRVGGASMTEVSFNGPDRESAFLAALRGPKGETVEYERLGSTPYEDTILDIYVITWEGLVEPLNIYIDMYNYAPLYAPVGLTCGGRFTISEP